jgi:hypothetical protein
MARPNLSAVLCALAAILVAFAPTSRAARPTPPAAPTYAPSGGSGRTHSFPSHRPHPQRPFVGGLVRNDVDNCTDRWPNAKNMQDNVTVWKETCARDVNEGCAKCFLWRKVEECVHAQGAYCSHGYYYSNPDSATRAWIIQGTAYAAQGIEAIQIGTNGAIDLLWKQAWEDMVGGKNGRDEFLPNSGVLVMNGLHRRTQHNAHIHGQRRSKAFGACIESLDTTPLLGTVSKWRSANCVLVGTKPTPIRYRVISAAERPYVNELVRDALPDVYNNAGVGVALTGMPTKTKNMVDNLLIIFDDYNVSDYELSSKFGNPALSSARSDYYYFPLDKRNSRVG